MSDTPIDRLQNFMDKEGDGCALVYYKKTGWSLILLDYSNDVFCSGDTVDDLIHQHGVAMDRVRREQGIDKGAE